MALQPPSYFQAPSTSSKQQSKNEKKLSAAVQVPLTSRHVLSTSPSLSATSGPLQLHLAGQQAAAAVLTNDLLAVETHLQSRVRLLEEEKKNLISRIVELEKSLVQQKEEGRAQLETLTTQHNQSLLQAQLEVKQLSTECHRLKEEGERRAAELERELRSREQLHSRERDSFTAKAREQEACVQALTEELEEVKQSSESELNQLRKQLRAATVELQRQRTDMEEQLKSLSEELKQSHQHASELESYLGGEIPQLPVEGDNRGLTWKEEREHLQGTIATLERDIHKLQSEDKLLNIRLTSLMEILSIQENTIAKEGFASVSHGCGTGEKDADSAAALKTLLSRWREKVFVMLVQQKLLQIQDSRSKHDASRKEAEFLEWIQTLEGEKELLNHSLADRNAELQLQISKTNLAEQKLDESLQATHLLQSQVQVQKEQLCYIVGGIQSLSKAQGSCTTAFNQAMTRMASCEHRLGMMGDRIKSVKATLNYQRAVQQKTGSIACVDCGAQTEEGEGETSGSHDLTCLSRAELISEVRSLSRERSSLVRQLQKSTATFEQQLNDISNTCSVKLANAEAKLTSMQGENHSLNEELSQLQSELKALTEKEEELKLRAEELEGELREARNTMETRVDMAVREKQQENNEAMAEMEKLLSVARREHGKAVVQLQQLQRQLGRDRDRAMEAMKLNQTRLEQQLEACRKKLEASQVERNLLLTAVRQEGHGVAVKQRASPRRKVLSYDTSDREEEEGASSIQSEDLRDCSGHSKSREEFHPPISTPSQTGPPPSSQTEDIREVLKDLQMLSASLLEMETSQVTITDPQNKT